MNRNEVMSRDEVLVVLAILLGGFLIAILLVWLGDWLLNGRKSPDAPGAKAPKTTPETRLPCWIKHDWSKWGEPKAFGCTLYQDATCLKCGKVKQRECGWDSNDNII